MKDLECLWLKKNRPFGLTIDEFIRNIETLAIHLRTSVAKIREAKDAGCVTFDDFKRFVTPPTTV